jgi:hypothetical protein
MANTSTSQAQAIPVAPLEARIKDAEAHTRGLRRQQELARISYGNAIRRQRATPKDAPEYPFAQAQTKRARADHEACRQRADAAQVVLDMLRDTLRQESEDAIAAATRAVVRENRAWAKDVKRAKSPFVFGPKERAPVRLRATSVGSVRAPCGVLCGNSEDMAIHRQFCAQCQSPSLSEIPESSVRLTDME